MKTRTLSRGKVAEVVVKRLPIGSLKPHPRNPRKHPKEDSPEWKVLEKSMAHDYFDPVVWNKRNGMLVSGHLRIKVLMRMGYREVDSVIVDYDEKTHLARMIAANKNIGWDDLPALDDILEEFKGIEDFDFSLAGFILPEVNYRVPEGNKTIDEDGMSVTNCECPKCGFKWIKT